MITKMYHPCLICYHIWQSCVSLSQIFVPKIQSLSGSSEDTVCLVFCLWVLHSELLARKSTGWPPIIPYSKIRMKYYIWLQWSWRKLVASASAWNWPYARHVTSCQLMLLPVAESPSSCHADSVWLDLGFRGTKLVICWRWGSLLIWQAL